jgi:hypothetical protein
MRRSLLLGIAVLLGWGGDRPAWLRAQVRTSSDRRDSVERFERRLEQIQRDVRERAAPATSIDQRVLIDYGAFVTFDFLAVDDPDQRTHILRQYDLVGYGRLNLDGAHELFARVRTSYRDFNSGDSFTGQGDDWVEPTLDRGHYRFDLRRAAAAYGGPAVDFDLVAQGGRQLVVWANGLVLNEELDGVIARIGNDLLSIDFVAAVTRPSIADFDTSRPGFLGDTHRGFFGGMLTARVGTHRPFLYFLAQRDYNDDSDTLVTGDVVTEFQYDSYYIGAGASGALSDNLLYSAELAFEGGKGLSNSFELAADRTTGTPISQTKEYINAFAANVRLDYLVNDPNRSRLAGEVILATGDDDRLHTSNTFGGNAPDTDDKSFNAFGLLNTGLAFAPDVSNLAMLRLGASTFPFPDGVAFREFQVGLDVFVFNKFDADAPVDEFTRNHHYLGMETDLYINWQITSDLAASLRYGVFFPGAGIDTDHDERHFLFTGVTYAF